MPKLFARLGYTLSVFALATVVFMGWMFAQAQKAHAAPQNFQFASSTPICSVTASGTTTAVMGVNVDKTYDVIASTTSGTGTFAVTVQGSTTGTAWNTVGTTTLSITATPSSSSFNSADRFPLLRCNVTTFTGSTPTAVVNMGY